MNKYQEALDFIVKSSCPQKTTCKECTMNKVCNSEAKYYIDVLQELVDKVEQLEKVLDKACEQLEDFDMTFNNADFENVRTKKQWKEELMKDVE